MKHILNEIEHTGLNARKEIQIVKIINILSDVFHDEKISDGIKKRISIAMQEYDFLKTI